MINDFVFSQLYLSGPNKPQHFLSLVVSSPGMAQ